MTLDLRFLALLATAALVLAMPAAQPLAAQNRPNIVLINLDDADAELFELPYSPVLFPNIMKLAEDGLTFSNFHVTTPLCGPSRACLYRGQYAHNTGIRVNRPGEQNANGFVGGFRQYRERGYFEDDLSVWLNDAGYRTMMVGKYLHGEVERLVPPGWDDFRHYFGARYYGARRFSNRVTAAGQMELLPPDQYRTVAEADEAVELIRAHAVRQNNQPFFLNVNPLGPHRASPSAPEMVEAHKRHWWPLILQPFSKAYNEADVQDKSSLFARLPLMSDLMQAANLTHYRERALATRSVDDLVGRIREALEQAGVAHNTYIFLTSDNGFLLGHHRAYGKGFPADRATRVPCIVVGPRVPAGQTAHQLIAHIDLAPTLVQLAKGVTPGFVDGRSFAGLLNANGLQQNPTFRRGILIENWASLNFYGQSNVLAAHHSVRFENAIYTEWASGEREYFDLATDPDQLENIYDQLSAEDRLWNAHWLRVLKNPAHSPTARFATVYEFDQAVAKQAKLSGLAEDWSQVTAVRIAIRNRQTGDYWNGSNWQSTFRQLDANVNVVGNQLTEWQFSNVPPGDARVPVEFAAWVWAYNDNGSYGPPDVVFYHYDRSAPGISISPDNQDQFLGPVSLDGSATDNVRVGQVLARVRNRQTNRYWNGSGFQLAPTDIGVDVSNNGSWNWRDTLPAGNYEFTAIAEDTSGIPSAPAIFEFQVK